MKGGFSRGMLPKTHILNYATRNPPNRERERGREQFPLGTSFQACRNETVEGALLAGRRATQGKPPQPCRVAGSEFP